MEKYNSEQQINEVGYTEPQDEYVCIKCENKVGLLINGMCFSCSNELDDPKQEQ